MRSAEASAFKEDNGHVKYVLCKVAGFLEYRLSGLNYVSPIPILIFVALMLIIDSLNVSSSMAYPTSLP